jgi:hypothetical protein
VDLGNFKRQLLGTLGGDSWQPKEGKYDSGYTTVIHS